MVLGRLLRKKWWVVNSINVENPWDSRSENILQVVDFPYLYNCVNKKDEQGGITWESTMEKNFPNQYNIH